MEEDDCLDTGGRSNLFEKFEISLFLLPPSTNVGGAAAVAHHHHRSRQDPAVPGLNPAKKVFQIFQLFPFQGIRRSFQGVTGQNTVLNGWHE